MIRALTGFFVVIAVAVAQFPYSVLPTDPSAAFVIRGLPETNKTIVPITGMPIPWAWRLRTPPNTDTNPWDSRLYTEGARAADPGVARAFGAYIGGKKSPVEFAGATGDPEADRYLEEPARPGWI